jgi:hypothetical protein
MAQPSVDITLSRFLGNQVPQMAYFCLPDTPARVGVVASGWPDSPTSLAGIAEQMALACQAQRCAVGKLDCYWAVAIAAITMMLTVFR